MFVLVAGERADFDDVGRTLRKEGLIAIAAADENQVLNVLRDSPPVCAVLLGTATIVTAPWSQFDRMGIPVVAAIAASSRGLLESRPTPIVMLPEDASPEEISATVMAILPRRRRLDEPARIACGPLVIDLEQRRVVIAGQEVDVPPKEYLILKEIVLADGTPVSSEELARAVWPNRAGITAEDVHRHIYRLRGRIGDHERPDSLIVNRRGYGYAVTAKVRLDERARM